MISFGHRASRDALAIRRFCHENALLGPFHCQDAAAHQAMLDIEARPAEAGDSLIGPRAPGDGGAECARSLPGSSACAGPAPRLRTVDSAITALSFRPSNASLKAASTFSGTLKLTVAMSLPLDCRRFQQPLYGAATPVKILEGPGQGDFKLRTRRGSAGNAVAGRGAGRTRCEARLAFGRRSGSFRLEACGRFGPGRGRRAPGSPERSGDGRGEAGRAE